jgi:hypothetical protein
MIMKCVQRTTGVLLAMLMVSSCSKFHVRGAQNGFCSEVRRNYFAEYGEKFRSLYDATLFDSGCSEVSSCRAVYPVGLGFDVSDCCLLYTSIGTCLELGFPEVAASCCKDEYGGKIAVCVQPCYKKTGVPPESHAHNDIAMHT